MHDSSIEAHPDLQSLRPPKGFGLRARWQARRNRARMRKQWSSPDVLRRRQRRTTLKLAAVILVAIAVVALVTYWDDIVGGTTAEPDVSRTSVPDDVDRPEPFEGTPPADWKDGLAGLKTPKIEAIGDFTAEEVRPPSQRCRRRSRPRISTRG